MTDRILVVALGGWGREVSARWQALAVALGTPRDRIDTLTLGLDEAGLERSDGGVHQELTQRLSSLDVTLTPVEIDSGLVRVVLVAALFSEQADTALRVTAEQIHQSGARLSPGAVSLGGLFLRLRRRDADPLGASTQDTQDEVLVRLARRPADSSGEVGLGLTGVTFLEVEETDHDSILSSAEHAARVLLATSGAPWKLSDETGHRHHLVIDTSTRWRIPARQQRDRRRDAILQRWAVDAAGLGDRSEASAARLLSGFLGGTLPDSGLPSSLRRQSRTAAERIWEAEGVLPTTPSASIRPEIVRRRLNEARKKLQYRGRTILTTATRARQDRAAEFSASVAEALRRCVATPAGGLAEAARTVSLLIAGLETYRNGLPEIREGHAITTEEAWTPALESLSRVLEEQGALSRTQRLLRRTELADQYRRSTVGLAEAFAGEGEQLLVAGLDAARGKVLEDLSAWLSERARLLRAIGDAIHQQADASENNRRKELLVLRGGAIGPLATSEEDTDRLPQKEETPAAAFEALASRLPRTREIIEDPDDWALGIVAALSEHLLSDLAEQGADAAAPWSPGIPPEPWSAAPDDRLRLFVPKDLAQGDVVESLVPSGCELSRIHRDQMPSDLKDIVIALRVRPFDLSPWVSGESRPKQGDAGEGSAAVNSEIQYRIRHRYPLPLAWAFARFLDRPSAGRADWRLPAVIEAMLRFLCLILVCDYLGTQREPSVDKVVRRILLQRNVSLGAWRDLLQRLSRALHDTKTAAFPELPALLRTPRMERHLKELVEERNRIVHKGDQVSNDDLGRFRMGILRFLQELSFFEDRILLHIPSRQEEGGEGTVALLARGQSTRLRQVTLPATPGLPHDRLVLAPRDGGEGIILAPLFFVGSCPDCGEHHLYQRARAQGRTTIYAACHGDAGTSADGRRSHERASEDGEDILEEILRGTRRVSFRESFEAFDPGTFDLDDLPALNPGDHVDGDQQYEVLDFLASGGMAHLYIVRAEGTEDRAVLKQLKPGLSRETGLRRRFEVEQREAMRLSGSSPEHLVRTLDQGNHQGNPFFVMELAEGWVVDGDTCRDLSDLRLPLQPGEVISIGRQICEGLVAVHSKGLIHRDLKPANVLLFPPDRVKLSDFGIVRVEDGLHMTRTGNFLGTPAYISPEHLGSSRDLVPASDLYCLGIILYELATGRLPYRADNLGDLLVMHRDLQRRPEPPRRRAPDVPPSLERIILKLLEKKLSQRYADAGEVLSDLDALSHG
ncbi:MAG: serine/threonine-protein kinase [Pseudomonadota bacterium]